VIKIEFELKVQMTQPPSKQNEPQISLADNTQTDFNMLQADLERADINETGLGLYEA
jgi:hypothetical protein